MTKEYPEETSILELTENWEKDKMTNPKEIAIEKLADKIIDITNSQKFINAIGTSKAEKILAEAIIGALGLKFVDDDSEFGVIEETRFRLSDCWQKCQASLEEVDDLDSSIANSYYEEQSKIESLQEAIKLIESEGIYREWMRMPVINIKDIKDAK
jgi:hypothetical protein